MPQGHGEGSKATQFKPSDPHCKNGHTNCPGTDCPRPTGTDSKWYPEINEELVKYFETEAYREITKLHPKSGAAYVDLVPNKLPQFGKFERDHGLSIGCLSVWAKEENKDKYPGFAEAYFYAKALQKEFLIENGLNGLYNHQFAIFTAKNITDMRDKQEIEGSGTWNVTVVNYAKRNDTP